MINHLMSDSKSELKVRKTFINLNSFYIRATGPQNILWREEGEKVCENGYWTVIFLYVLCYNFSFDFLDCIIPN